MLVKKIISCTKSITRFSLADSSNIYTMNIYINVNVSAKNSSICWSSHRIMPIENGNEKNGEPDERIWIPVTTNKLATAFYRVYRYSDQSSDHQTAHKTTTIYAEKWIKHGVCLVLFCFSLKLWNRFEFIYHNVSHRKLRMFKQFHLIK